MEQEIQLESKKYRGERVRLCEDGKYRWTYSLNMYKNPSIILTVLKIFGIIWAVALLLLLFSALKNDSFGNFLENLKILGIVLAVFFAITILAYLIVAGMYGGRYIVNFTMDEGHVIHEQTPAQAKKARKLGYATMAAGAASGRFSTMGAGAAATRTVMSSDFNFVRKVKPYRGRNLIKVNERLGHNQVYVQKEDFDFVLDYIKSRCPKLK